MPELNDLTKTLVKFRNARNWKQFHTPKDLALSVAIESSELLEHFQWRTEKEVAAFSKDYRGKIAEEMADILSYLLLLGNELKIDLIKATKDKIRKNGEKYPVKTIKGVHTNKYR